MHERSAIFTTSSIKSFSFWAHSCTLVIHVISSSHLFRIYVIKVMQMLMKVVCFTSVMSLCSFSNVFNLPILTLSYLVYWNWITSLSDMQKLRKMVVNQLDMLCFQPMHSRDCSQVWVPFSCWVASWSKIVTLLKYISNQFIISLCVWSL